jgi:acyl-CoA synthetase (AMP-forming)/AMP-acid ligase II
MLMVHDFLEQSAQRTPDKVALVCDGQRLTYAQIDALANRLAHALREHGVERGDRVGLFLPNSVELVVGIFATLKANAVFVVINHTTKREKLSHLVDHCHATAMVTSAQQIQLTRDLLQQADSLKFAVVAGKGSSEAVADHPVLLSLDAIDTDYPTSRPDRQCIDRDLACLNFTSGSTGVPKGVKDHRLGSNQVGELVIRGRHVMRGYWDNPQATAKKYRSGSIPGEQICYSGDLFRMDEDAYYYFISRKDDIIKCRGEKVAPKEIEHVLYGLPEIAEAAVIGVPDPILGQAVKAFVVSSNGMLSEKDVLMHCKAKLEDFMIPKYVEFVESLPKTTSGKIRKNSLG